MYIRQGMYSRSLSKRVILADISDILLPFSRRTHRVRTAKMSLYIKNLSQNSSFKRFREYIVLNGGKNEERRKK